MCHIGEPHQVVIKSLTGSCEAERVSLSHNVLSYPGLAGDCLPELGKPAALGEVGNWTACPHT